MERVTLPAGGADSADVTRRFHVVCVIGGRGRIVCPREDVPSTTISAGDTYLIPSAVESYEIIADEKLTALRAYVPLPA